VLIIDDLFSSGTVLREMYKVVSQTSPAQIHTLVLAKIPQGQPYATESEIENYVLEKTDSQILKKLINHQNISYTRRFFDAVISTRFGLYEELLISLEKNNPEILEQLAQYLVYRGLGVPVRKNDMLFSVLNKLYPHSERPAYFYPLVLQ
jgi:hypoxanthine phosphoribosyltransferase